MLTAALRAFVAQAKEDAGLRGALLAAHRLSGRDGVLAVALGRCWRSAQEDAEPERCSHSYAERPAGLSSACGGKEWRGAEWEPAP